MGREGNKLETMKNFDSTYWGVFKGLVYRNKKTLVIVSNVFDSNNDFLSEEAVFRLKDEITTKIQLTNLTYKCHIQFKLEEGKKQLHYIYSIEIVPLLLGDKGLKIRSDLEIVAERVSKMLEQKQTSHDNFINDVAALANLVLKETQKNSEACASE